MTNPNGRVSRGSEKQVLWSAFSEPGLKLTKSDIIKGKLIKISPSTLNFEQNVNGQKAVGHIIIKNTSGKRILYKVTCTDQSVKVYNSSGVLAKKKLSKVKMVCRLDKLPMKQKVTVSVAKPKSLQKFHWFEDAWNSTKNKESLKLDTGIGDELKHMVVHEAGDCHFTKGIAKDAAPRTSGENFILAFFIKMLWCPCVVFRRCFCRKKMKD
ncbi:hypothetical protein CAPTEDRAFT_200385 [Capitella teleta]|uniref:MSP domain-containing protein n=1 Tax=Capitella teleta TaxID=283909 RepID=R7UTN6_CAPTE|nr:hypothetical protein CAPTEDRAFT_200385 [Capitella teleta]|eukprot:ELU09513.1 hypothetical protein CAPTEDRAFT_200385 [Capitella teleta]